MKKDIHFLIKQLLCFVLQLLCFCDNLIQRIMINVSVCGYSNQSLLVFAIRTFIYLIMQYPRSHKQYVTSYLIIQLLCRHA